MLKEGVRIIASKIAAGSERANEKSLKSSASLTYAVENWLVICIDCARAIFPPAAKNPQDVMYTIIASFLQFKTYVVLSKGLNTDE